MKKLLIQLLINAVALYAAVALLNGRGIQPQSENWLSFVWLAIVFGVINSLFGPLLKFLTCPLIILTLGLGSLLINTLLFFAAGAVGTQFGFGFTVDGFWPAFLGALIVSLVSLVLNNIFKSELKEKKHDK